MFDLKEAAKRLGVSVDHVRALVDDGRLRYVNIGRGRKRPRYRFADADLLPYDFTLFADTMHRYSAEVKKLLSDKQEEIRTRNEAIDGGMYDAASDPRHPLLAPPNVRAVPAAARLPRLSVLMVPSRSDNVPCPVVVPSPPEIVSPLPATENPKVVFPFTSNAASPASIKRP